MATSEVIHLKNVRLSFPRLFNAKAFRAGQDPRFEASFLLDPSNPEHAEAIKTIKRQAKIVATEEWGNDIPKAVKKCYGSGDEKDYDGYAGMFYIATSNKTRPSVVDRDRSPLTAEDGKPYAGCYVNATITVWSMDGTKLGDSSWGKRINANLRAVQFVRDGEAFGVQPVDAEEEFEDLSDEDFATADDGADDSDDDFLD